MELMKPEDIEVYTEVFSSIAALAHKLGKFELEDEAFDLSVDVYRRDYKKEYIKNKVKEFKERLNEKGMG